MTTTRELGVGEPLGCRVGPMPLIVAVVLLIGCGARPQPPTAPNLESPAGQSGSRSAADANRTYSRCVECDAPSEALRALLRERTAFDHVNVLEAVAPSRTRADVLAQSEEEAAWLVEQVRTFDRVAARRARYKAMSDSELRVEWERVDPVPPDFRGVSPDRGAVLIEVGRRDPRVWEPVARQRFESLIAWRIEQSESSSAWDSNELDELVVLQRLAGIDRPVSLEIVWPEGPVRSELPRVAFRIVNLSGHDIMFTEGGDYRTGRQERFHLEVRDTDNRLVGDAPFQSIDSPGGVASRRLLSNSETVSGAIQLSRYCAPLAAGQYRVRVHYSDVTGIAHPSGLLEQVTIASEWRAVSIQE